MNVFQAISVGFTVLAAISGLAMGQSTTFKLGNQWYKLQEVAGPNSVAAKSLPNKAKSTKAKPASVKPAAKSTSKKK